MYTLILFVTDFIGRFHPVVVHLPIGILLLACLFQLFSKKYAALQPAVPAMLFWGTAGAVVSCMTGFLLSLSGDYDKELTDRHQWMGIMTAALSLVFYLFLKKGRSLRFASGFAAALIALITTTGHLGGSLTHGSGYLTEALGKSAATGLKPIPDVQEAVLYTDVVQPILQSNCYSCHGPSKQKGKLRLDEMSHILEGGKNGVAVAPGDPDESELVQRLLLPLSDDEHMPPKEKPQLTPNEVALLHWWVSTGADFTKKVKELEQTEKIKPVLTALQTGAPDEEMPKSSDIPEEAVAKADDKAIQALRDAGVVVLPVAKDNNYLMASFVTAADRADTLIKLLEPLREQLVWLRLDDASVSDESADVIARLSNLTRLYLRNTKITDAGLAKMQSLTQLQVLNLVNTPVTEGGLLQLKELKALRTVYLYQARINKTAWEELKAVFPTTVLDTGGYMLPVLTKDSVLVTSEIR